MNENPGLIQKQNELKDQMAGYRSLPEYILDGLGSVLQHLFNPSAAKARTALLPPNASDQPIESFPSFWLNGLIIAFITFLIGWLVSIGVGYQPTSAELKLMSWSSFTGALALVINKVNIRTFLDTFRLSCVDKILSASDLDELGGWLRSNFKLWLPLISGLVVGPVLGQILYNSWLINPTNLATFQVGPFVTIVLSSIQAVWVAFYLYPFYVAFPSRLNRYHFDLYTSNPSSSEVIGQLSRLLTFILYATMGYIVQLTAGLTFIGVLKVSDPLPIIIFSIFVWAPTVILYVAGQFHLSNVITFAKWKTLNEVQTKIENLYKSKEIPDKEMLENLEKLMNYHDRIKSTPNSALDFRTGLNFLNSLLFPIFAFFLKDVPSYVKDLMSR
ncbi:MAG: hypothetical protein HZB50_11575 [Chloroflexi bacterium]|nr:hypothetical protein [Chloroflexota bacterium]